jgi:hypothetical protein
MTAVPPGKAKKGHEMNRKYISLAVWFVIGLLIMMVINHYRHQ